MAASQSFASIAAQGQQSLQPFSNLDLTEAQRASLRSIFTTAKQSGAPQADVQQQVNAVLTPAQQQTLTSDLKSGFAGQHHHRDTAPSQVSTTSDDSASTSPATSTDETVFDAVTNVQNQAAAARSALIETLQSSVLATNGASAE